MDDRDLQLLRRLRDESSPPAEEVAAARRMLNAEIRREMARVRPARRLAWAPQAAALTAAAAVIAVVISLGGQLLRPPPATAALTEIVSAVEARPVLTPSVGSGVYVVSSRVDLVQVAGEDVPGVDDQVFSFRLPQTREVWLRSDGSRLLRVTTGQPEFFEPAHAELFAASGLADAFGVGRVELIDFAPPEFTLDLDALPLEPAELRSVLLAEAGPSEESEAATLLRMAGVVLRETTARPELRGAVIGVLADLGDELDVIADDGEVLEVATEFTSSGSTLLRSLTFDISTGGLIGETLTGLDVTDDFGVPDETVLIDAVYSIPELAPLP